MLDYINIPEANFQYKKSNRAFKNQKMFFTFLPLFTLVAGSNPLANYLLLEKFGDDTSDLMKMMLLSPGLLGQNPQQSDQISQILPFMLHGDDLDNSKKMMFLMMSQPNAQIESLLPLLLLEDDTVDLKTLFMLTTAMQANCDPTNDQLNQLLPMLLFDNFDSIGEDLQLIIEF